MSDSLLPTPLTRYLEAARRVQDPGQRPGQWAMNALLVVRRDMALQVRGTPLDPFDDDDRLPRYFEWVKNNWGTRAARERPLAHVSFDALVEEMEHLYEKASLPEDQSWAYAWEAVNRLGRAEDDSADVRRALVGMLEVAFGVRTGSEEDARTRALDRDLRAMHRLRRVLETSGVDAALVTRAIDDLHGTRRWWSD